MIVIKNLNKEKPTKPYQVRVDSSSGSPLGNPFHYMIKSEGESSRDYCIDKYREWLVDKIDVDDKVTKVSNHAGGILGGMSDGTPIKVRASFKPTPSISSFIFI